MELSFDNPKPRARTGLFFAILLVMLGGFTAAGAAASVSPSAAGVSDGCESSCDEAEHAEAEDDCDDECPGELPNGECVDGCQHCGCCSSTVPSLIVFGDTVGNAIELRRTTPPQTSSGAPTGVLRGVFKPPRRLSV